MKKVERFFIPFSKSTYGEKAAYIFVDFRIKRACRAYYRGATFRLMRKTAKLHKLNNENGEHYHL
jgi:hypothetical protein